MQLRPLIVAAGLVLAITSAVQPAAAAVCILLPLGSAYGTLGDPTQNYSEMSSEEGGSSASFTAAIVAGTSTITVGAPSVVYTGPHSHSGDLPQVKYRAVDTFGTVRKDQAYTNQSSTFTINSLLGTVTATVNGKITNSGGFAQGDYQLKTVVTCS